MTTEDVPPDPPDWAVTWERTDGRTVFRDEQGEPLVALAVTSEELRRLESGLRLLPASEATAALLDRLAVLHMNLDESAD